MTRSIVLTEHKRHGPDRELRLQAQESDTSEVLQRNIEALRGKLDVYEHRTGVSIETFAYVGRVRLGELVIVVKPKLADEAFLRLLSYVHELDDLELRDLTWFDTTGSSVQELFIAQLQARVRDVVNRGLARRYRAHADELESPRGKVDIRRWAASGRMMGAQVPCIHHARSADQLLNAVLLSGVTLAKRLTSSSLRRAELWELERRLSAEVRPVRLGGHVFRAARALLNRLVLGYERPLELIEMLHTCSGASWQDDASVELDGFLFDMDAFFQKLLRRFLSSHLPSDCKVESEKRLHELYRYSVNPRNSHAPKPRPDFTVRRGSKTWLLDAKYRDLWNKGLPATMLYQLSVYALSQGQGATAAILYPTESPEAREEVLTICAPETGGALGRVALRPVLMPELVSVLSDPVSHDAQALAHTLAFGEQLPRTRHDQRVLVSPTVELTS